MIDIIRYSIKIFYSPTKALEKLTEKSPRVLPLLLFLCITNIPLFFSTDIFSKVLTNQWPQLPTHTFSDIAVLKGQIYDKMFDTTIKGIAIWFVLSFALYKLIRIIDKNVELRKIQTLLAYIFVIVAVGKIIGFSFAKIFNAHFTISQEINFAPGLSLIFLLHNSYYLFHYLLREVNPFTIWGLYIGIKGVLQVTKLSPKQASLIIILTWIIFLQIFLLHIQISELNYPGSKSGLIQYEQFFIKY